MTTASARRLGTPRHAGVRNRFWPPGREGMTLLELLVGLTITGLALTAGYSALASLLDRRAQAEQTLDSSIQAAKARKLIRGLLSGARLEPGQDGPSFAGLSGFSEGLPDDAISFLTSSATALGVPETLVRLSIDRDDRTPERGLIATLSQWRGMQRRVVEVDSRVTALRLRYTSMALAPNRGWLPSWISTTLLPSAVEVSLDGDSLPPLLTLPMLVPVRSGR